jgi:hypothetical protein
MEHQNFPFPIFFVFYEQLKKIELLKQKKRYILTANLFLFKKFLPKTNLEKNLKIWYVANLKFIKFNLT